MKRLKPGAKKKTEEEKVVPITIYKKGKRVKELGGIELCREISSNAIDNA